MLEKLGDVELAHAHLAHVLLGGEHQLVIDDPVRLALEERRRRVDEHRCPVRDCLVPLLRSSSTAQHDSELLRRRQRASGEPRQSMARDLL